MEKNLLTPQNTILKTAIVAICLIFTSFGAFADSPCYPAEVFDCSNPATTGVYTFYNSGTYNASTGKCTGTSGTNNVTGYCGYSNSSTVPPADSGDYPACNYQYTGKNPTRATFTGCNFYGSINAGLIFLIVGFMAIGGYVIHKNEKQKQAKLLILEPIHDENI